MLDVTFITGNAKKAEYLSKYLGINVEHEKIDLDEIQSLSLREIIEHKARQAYERVKKPVLVEDVSLEFSALSKLPWPFIKFFEQELWLDGLCRLLDGKDRNAKANCTFWYFDWTEVKIFEWNIEWSISESPRGENGYGWDRIFIPYFTDKTSAELTPEEYERFYTEEKPFTKVWEFLLSL